MSEYTYSELDAMAHSNIKSLAIQKCKDENKPTSWCQTTRKHKLIMFILGKHNPFSEDKDTVPAPAPTPAPNPAPSTPPAGSLEDMLAERVADKIGDDIYKKNEEMRDAFIDEVRASNANVAKMIDQKVSHLQRPVVVKINDVETKVPDGLKHKQFTRVLKTLKTFKRVWLCGPSGTGKSHLVEQCAEALGFKAEDNSYQYLKGSAGVTEAHMTGRMTFDGTFIDGVVSNTFRGGKFLCLDEFDAFDANAGLIFNSVFDNQGIISTPNDKDNPHVMKHENFHVAVCSNTWGDGTDFEFAGRGQLDLATLDRLQLQKVYVDYDKNIERALVGEFSELAQMFWNLRAKCDENHINRTISTRCFLDGQKWRLAGDSNSQILDTFTKNWTKEELDKVDIKSIKREYK